MAWLIQWAIGLRAAAAITSERQRGTWDSLLVSPLEGQAIVWAKIAGSIYGLRGLLAAALVPWLAGLWCGAFEPGIFAQLLLQTLVIGSFMAVIGIAFSLHCESTTRAMTGTILIWLGAGGVFTVLAGITAAMVVFAWMLWTMWHGVPPVAATPRPWFHIVFESVRLTLYGLAALLVGVYLSYRFDQVTGRSTGAKEES
jgi:ABC-type Na+ efflux pump permease subunit